jgi:hypothetical protein
MENPTGTRNPPETRWVRVRDSTRGCGRGRVWSHFAGAVAGGFLLHPTRTRPVAIPEHGALPPSSLRKGDVGAYVKKPSLSLIALSPCAEARGLLSQTRLRPNR